MLQSKVKKTQNVQNYTHTEHAEKMAHCDYRDGGRKSGKGENTDSSRKTKLSKKLSF